MGSPPLQQSEKNPANGFSALFSFFQWLHNPIAFTFWFKNGYWIFLWNVDQDKSWYLLIFHFVVCGAEVTTSPFFLKSWQIRYSWRWNKPKITFTILCSIHEFDNCAPRLILSMIHLELHLFDGWPIPQLSAHSCLVTTIGFDQGTQANLRCVGFQSRGHISFHIPQPRFSKPLFSRHFNRCT